MRSTLIQPKIEAEIAFVLESDLGGPGLTVADVLRATEGVVACYEIVDSRIAGSLSLNETPWPPQAPRCKASFSP